MLGRLEVAYQVAMADLRRFADEGRLADDLPLLMVARAKTMPPELLKVLDEQLSSTKSGWFDSHPAPRDRIRSTATQGGGVFADDRPAAQLFSDFGALSRGVTWDLYRSVFGSRFQPSMMHATESLLQPATTRPSPPQEIPLD